MHPPNPPSQRSPYSLYSLLILALLLTIFAGCDTPQPPVPTNGTPTLPATPTHPPRPRGGTLTVRLTSDVGSFNPWLSGRDASAQTVAGLVFSGLTRLDNHLQPQPDLASSWEVSEDGTSITFHLRQNVQWHDNKPFTAQDVVWSYNTLARLPADTPTLLHIQDSVVSVKAVDPVTYTVRFNLKRRYSPIMADLSMPILPSHILSNTTPDKLAASPFNSAPVGTGPFAYESRQLGQLITLKSNPKYYTEQPAIDRVAFLVAPDDKVAEGAVKNNLLMLAQLPPDAAERLVKVTGGTTAPSATKGTTASNNAIKGGFYDEPGFDFIAFNLRPTHVFSDTRLRKAFAWALDKPGLVFAATGSNNDPVWSDVPKASWAYNPNVPQFGGDPDKARSLLSEAGWHDTDGDGIVDKDSKPLEVTLYVRVNDPVRRKAADLIADEEAKVGIRVNVEVADFNTALLARISPNSNPPFDFDAMMLGWTRLGRDPDPFALFHSSQAPTQAEPSLLNFTGFSAPEYDSLVINARSTYDYAARTKIYARTQEIVAGELPYYFLWAQKFGIVASPKLHGDIDFTSPRYLWNVDQWWIK